MSNRSNRISEIANVLSHASQFSQVQKVEAPPSLGLIETQSRSGLACSCAIFRRAISAMSSGFDTHSRARPPTLLWSREPFGCRANHSGCCSP